MTLLFVSNLGFVWGSGAVGGGSQTRITMRLVVQDGDDLEEIFK